MGKKDKKKKKGLGIEKTASKTEKKAIAKQKKQLQKLGEADIEEIVASIQADKIVETTEIITSNPSPRTNFAICSLDDTIFMLGGEFYDGKKTDVYGDFYTYHTVKKEWKKLTCSPAPTPRSGHQMIATQQNGGELYVFAGEYASPSQLQFLHFRDLWKFSLSTRRWEKLNAPQSPSARSGHRCVLLKKKIYLFGGFHDNNNSYQYFNDLWCFSLENYAWKKIETVGTGPTARSGVVMGATEDGKIIIYGGYTKTSAKGDAERGITHTDCFSLQETDGKWKWSSVKPGGRRLAPRSGIATAIGPNAKIFTFGGVMDTEEDDENLRGQFSNEVHFLDTQSGGIAWRKLELKTKKVESKAESSCEMSDAPKNVKTTTDGVFTITVGGVSTAKSNTELSTANIDVGGPSPRMNAGLVIVRNQLYVFGGSYEQGSRLFTLCDFHSIDASKFDSWKTIIGNMPSLTWLGSDSENSSDDDSMEDDSDDSEDDDDDSDEMETD